MKSRRRRILAWVAVSTIGTFVVMQLVPYGRSHDNPEVTSEPVWSSPATRALAERACFDCHSNQTRWPWYSHVAPASWLVQHHVDEGRAVLNFSEWARGYEEADDAAEAVLDREMPPASYVVLHPSARLSAAERTLLAEGLRNTFGGETHAEADED